MGGVTVRSRPRKAAPGQVKAKRAEAIAAVPAESTLPHDGTVTLMFSDVCDYSGITDRLGDVAANELLREYVAIVRGHIDAQGGHVVKSHGDGLMIAFPSVVRGLRCAVDVQLSLAKRNIETVDEPWRRCLRPLPICVSRTRTGVATE